MNRPASSTAVEIAQMWHHLADCQTQLDSAAAAARARVALPDLKDEDRNRISVTVDSTGDRVTMRIALVEATPETLRAWITPDLALLRARTPDGTQVERLVRLPASVHPDTAETDRRGATFTITLDRRSALPTSLWPPMD
jgi:hypothetical protein